MTQEIWPYWGVREPVSAGTHFPAFLCSIYATLLLWRLCRGDRPRQWAMAVYGASMIVQYAASTLYHSMRGAPEYIHLLRLLDQSAIFGLIAGSYTPAIYVFISDPGRRRFLLKAIWLMALVGIAAKWLLPREHYGLTVAVYFCFAGSGLVAIKELRHVAGTRGLLWVLYGGLFYVLGAVVDFFEWPAFYPGVFAHHELFHLFTMAGTFCHFAFMVIFVAPYQAAGADRFRTHAGASFAFAGSEEAD